MTDISGQTFFAFSESVDPPSSWESRLRARMDSLGSTLYRLTWKTRVTPSGRQICALRGSVRRTFDSDCSGWVTPTTRDHKDMGPERNRGKADQLPRQAHLAGWGTPRASNANGVAYNYSQGDHAKKALTLVGMAQAAGGATPTANQPGGTVEAFLKRKRKAVANGSSLGISFTDLGMQASLALGQTLTGSSVTTQAVPDGARLNPDLSRWLQGYPATWGNYAPTETASFLKSRRNSSART